MMNKRDWFWPVVVLGLLGHYLFRDLMSDEFANSIWWLSIGVLAAVFVMTVKWR